MNIRHDLSQADLFMGLTVEQLEKIARIVSDREYKKGQLIFSDGDEGVGGGGGVGAGGQYHAEWAPGAL